LNSTLVEFLYFLGVPGIAGTAVVLIGRRLIDRSFDRDAEEFRLGLQRDLERFKANLDASAEEFRVDLQRSAFRHQTQYVRLFGARFDVIHELHGLLIVAREKVRALSMNVGGRESPDYEALLKDATPALEEFRDYFFRNQLVLTDDLIGRVDELLTKLFRCINFSIISPSPPSPAPQRAREDWAKRWQEVVKLVTEDLPTIERDIRGLMRRDLGVESDPPVDVQSEA